MAFVPFQILYEDANILVCVKPAGIAAETKKAGQQDMASLLRNYRHSKGEEPYIGLVHRLDQPVEGIMAFGKNTQCTAALCRQLTQGAFLKIYLAAAEGTLPADKGCMLDYLKKDGRTNTTIVSHPGDPKAKKAKLRYEVLKTDTKTHPVQSLVKIQLLTGRHHQIRVQMASRGAPLVGDAKYGRKPASNTSDSGLGLCACVLEFKHPFSKEDMRFQIVPSQAIFKKYQINWGGLENT